MLHFFCLEVLDLFILRQNVVEISNKGNPPYPIPMQVIELKIYIFKKLKRIIVKKKKKS